MANCRALFETEERWKEFEKDFRDLVYTKTEEDYKDLLREFKDEFNWNDGEPYQTLNRTPNPKELEDLTRRDIERQALVYVLGQWLQPYKHLLVHA